MNSHAPRQLRADAARNYERILRAARETFAASGPNAPLEEIARRAGVGIATLYRRFPDREELVRQAIEQLLTEMISPATQQALADENPKRGLATLLGAAMSIATRERNTLAATKDIRATTKKMANQFFQSLTLLTQRGQQAGLIRADLVPEDLYTIMGMLVGALWTTDPDSDGWRRYVTLLLDALSPDAASPLPPSAPKIWTSERWPIPADD
jgi:AcrR family transcriptional regulator